MSNPSCKSLLICTLCVSIVACFPLWAQDEQLTDELMIMIDEIAPDIPQVVADPTISVDPLVDEIAPIQEPAPVIVHTTPTPVPTTPTKTIEIPQATFTPPSVVTETTETSDQTSLVEFYPTIVSNCMIQDGEIIKCNFGADYRKSRIDELFTNHIAGAKITRKQYQTMLNQIYLLSHKLPETTSRQENNSAFMIEYAHYLLEKKRNGV